MASAIERRHQIGQQQDRQQNEEQGSSKAQLAFLALSAVDLTFASVFPRVLQANVKSKNRTRFISLPVLSMLTFANEVRISEPGHWLAMTGYLRATLTFFKHFCAVLRQLPQLTKPVA